MKVDEQEYLKNLYYIQNENIPTLIKIAPIIPSYEKIYKINLEERTVEQPKEINIIQSDHNSETIFFTVPRYYDNYDLVNTTCVITYRNAKGATYNYPVPYYDIDTMSNINLEAGRDEPMILLPWRISQAVTALGGNVQFIIRFYEFNENNLVYLLNTQAQNLVIKNSLPMPAEDDFTQNELFESVKEEYLQQLNIIRNTALQNELKWIVL